ncbi:MAG: hypothetical protein AW10_00795 [Candidatus Accumulibacter appositus]|uniref:DUF4845 domain-containing protein n=1 Tax=Candidatus Accumulibacter appositus TaxID=1454003 RepID=A0A011PZ03_9PROT|nr:DUF4845 domain-containing protein [Accumulibacter sp.]EXI82110.1 MAG: hypothetical protein AW10_00795 [Candidatus Accumulibacter appositus]HRF03432.1 DUF4845 domain-containing protein [Accumulibacter sp.]
MTIKRQRGLALSALLLWGIAIGLVAILVIRVLPDVIEYSKIRHAVKAVASESSGKTVAEIRHAFGQYAEVEHIKTLGPADLDVFKEENQVVVAFAYERRIPLAGNVSLLIEFSGSSSARDSGQ